MKKQIAVDIAFIVCLVALVAFYSVHLLSFSLFDGFTTFSNDAGIYVLLGQKWSPHFAPTDSVIHTYASSQYPPVFPLLLALTGASNSLWAGHLLVSIMMLMGIVLVGWITYRRAGARVAGAVTLAFCLLPGVLVSSMGILSENLYLLLSLCSLFVFFRINDHKDIHWTWFLGLALSLALLVLTRTIGIAFIAAVLLVALFYRPFAARQRAGLLMTVVVSVSIWILWSVVDPQTDGLSYKYQIDNFLLADKSLLQFLVGTLKTNSVQVVSAWNHYLTLHQSGFWYFILPASLLLISLVATGLRAAQFKVDAIYLLAYFAIILVWPFPEEMMRFLHPVIFLMFLQPVFLMKERVKSSPSPVQNAVLVIVFLSLSFNSVLVHSRLVDSKSVAAQRNPELVHTYELYASNTIAFDLKTADHFVDVTRYMLKSAEFVPAGGTVATTKPVNYALLTDVRAVDLVNTVSETQQLCNLRVKDVDLVFLSALVSGLNWEGHNNADKYHQVARETWKLEGGASQSFAYAILIDKGKLEAKLEDEKYPCHSYKIFE